MNFSPVYRVHVADPLGFADNPFIVTTAYTNAGGYPKGEWFLFVPDGSGVLYAQRTRLDHTTFPAGQVMFDEDFLLNELLEQAKLRLRRHILETQPDRALELLSRRLDALPSSSNLFVNLWMRSNYQAQLIEIGRKTECDPLMEFLRWVAGLPVLSNSDV